MTYSICATPSDSLKVANLINLDDEVLLELGLIVGEIRPCCIGRDFHFIFVLDLATL